MVQGKATLADADLALQALTLSECKSSLTPACCSAREIARQFNRSKIYDSVYVALAELRGCEFWTADHLLFNAVKAVLPFVKFLADYP